MYNFVVVGVNGISLFIVINYRILKPRLVKINFSQNRLILINFLSYGTTLVAKAIYDVLQKIFYVFRALHFIKLVIKEIYAESNANT